MTKYDVRAAIVMYQDDDGTAHGPCIFCGEEAGPLKMAPPDGLHIPVLFHKECFDQNHAVVGKEPFEDNTQKKALVDRYLVLRSQANTSKVPTAISLRYRNPV